MPSRPRTLAFKAGTLRGFGLIVLLAISGPTLSAEQVTNPEYQLKAVFLFNFLQFVEWPTSAFSNSDSPIRIGVLGDDPFGPILERAFQGETIRHRPLVVERSNHVEDLKDSHLIFVSKSEKAHFPEILSQFNSKNTLTVSETEGFARRGGIINFYLEGKKVRFEINTNAAQNHGLKLSSQLLGLGKIINPEEPKGEK
jgi:hypothetical protein